MKLLDKLLRRNQKPKTFLRVNGGNITINQGHYDEVVLDGDCTVVLGSDVTIGHLDMVACKLFNMSNDEHTRMLSK